MLKSYKCMYNQWTKIIITLYWLRIMLNMLNFDNKRQDNYFIGLYLKLNQFK